jgi:hypothetical protein
LARRVQRALQELRDAFDREAVCGAQPPAREGLLDRGQLRAQLVGDDGVDEQLALELGGVGADSAHDRVGLRASLRSACASRSHDKGVPPSGVQALRRGARPSPCSALDPARST